MPGLAPAPDPDLDALRRFVKAWDAYRAACHGSATGTPPVRAERRAETFDELERARKTLELLGIV